MFEMFLYDLFDTNLEDDCFPNDETMIFLKYYMDPEERADSF